MSPTLRSSHQNHREMLRPFKSPYSGQISLTQDRQTDRQVRVRHWLVEGAGVSVWLVTVTAEWQVSDSKVPHQPSVGPDLPKAFSHSLHSPSLTERHNRQRERVWGRQTGLGDSEIITVSTDCSLTSLRGRKMRGGGGGASQQVECFITSY